MIEAAETAVDTAVEGLDLITATDPRADRINEIGPSRLVEVWSDPVSGKRVGAIREDGRWLLTFLRPDRIESDADVYRVDPAGRYLTGSVADGKHLEDVIGRDGRVPGWVLDAWVSRMDADALAARLRSTAPLDAGAVRDAAGTVRRLESRTDKILALGDSLTEGYGDDGIGGGWPARLGATFTGTTITNAGISGRTSTERTIEAGAICPLITVAGNSIPAGGTQTVTAITPTASYRANVSGGGTWSVTGTLGPGGPAATLSNDQSAAAGAGWTVTLASPGTVTAVAPGTPFVVTGGLAGTIDRNSVLIFALGRNNETPAVVLRDLRAMLGYLAPIAPRWLAVSVLTTTAETAGSAGYDQVAAVNAALADFVGDRFVDARRHIVDNALDFLTSEGVTPTADDIMRATADIIPVSLHASGDNVHLDGLGYDLHAEPIATALTQKGWAIA